MLIDLAGHALVQLSRRNIDVDWVQRTLAAPYRTEADPLRPGVFRYDGMVPEGGGRILRVAAVPLPGGFRVITAILDRGERRTLS